ncbi:hypothetical protein FRX31_030120 [Thalictrum thalictroides]|uniref:Uncharacterized protein n=1 Tax=Thalictrum thalictroides TaxID=46969 RepID=A0A7J6V6L6_THATH|nr:hypothetical protein FRX31_030120 [Thalictrum thalictroides]
MLAPATESLEEKSNAVASNAAEDNFPAATIDDPMAEVLPVLVWPVPDPSSHKRCCQVRILVHDSRYSTSSSQSQPLDH